MVRSHKETPARVCFIITAVQHLLRSGDRVVLQRFREDDTILADLVFFNIGRGRTGRDTAGPGAEGGMGNAVCRRCWERVQVASRASKNDGGYRGSIRCIWLVHV